MFAECLESQGYTLNPYDMCVANKMVRGHQMTIAFYVDDLFACHVDIKALEELRTQIEDQFGKMEAVFGEQQTYLELLDPMQVHGKGEHTAIFVGSIQQPVNVLKLLLDLSLHKSRQPHIFGQLHGIGLHCLQP